MTSKFVRLAGTDVSGSSAEPQTDDAPICACMPKFTAGVRRQAEQNLIDDAGSRTVDKKQAV